MPEKKMTPDEMHKALFVNLVMMLGSSAMQQLGKLVDPMTNKTETNLDGARVTIDMLEMIQKKTQGNLDEDENKMLSDLISSLQMNYVETSQSAPEEITEDTPKEKAEETPEEKTEETVGEKAEEKTDTKEDKKDPKFHKTYGE